MTRRPLSVSVTLIFLLLNALVWLGLGAIITTNAHPALPNQPLLKGVMAFLSFTAAIILLGLLIFLIKRNRIAYYPALAFLAATSLLTIFDQFGMSDLFVLIINIVPVILLIKDRAWYIR